VNKLKLIIRNNLNIVILILLSLSTNYLFYFSEIGIADKSIIIIICLLFVLVCTIIPFTQFMKFLIFIVLVFPKRPIGSEYSNVLLRDIMTMVGIQTFSFVEMVLFPLILISYFVHIIIRSKDQLNNGNGLFFMLILYLFQLLLYYFISSAEFNFFLYIYSAMNFSKILIAFIFIKHFKELKCCRNYVMKLLFVLILIFYVEIVLAAMGVIPASEIYDFRDGFRSSIIGYAVEVGFMSFLATLFGLHEFFFGKKKIYIILVFLASILQLFTFDRGNLYLSLLAIACYLIYNKPVLSISLLISLLVFYTPVFSLIESSKMYEIKSTSGDLLGNESAMNRWSNQIFYLSKSFNNFFLPSGVGLNSITNSKFELFVTGDIILAQESHNLLIQIIYEAGIIVLFSYAFSVLRIYKVHGNMFLNFALVLIVLYFCFQSRPCGLYFFILPLIFSDRT